MSIAVLPLVVTAMVGTVAPAFGDATVYVVHGIPNVPVDVAVDGGCAIEGFMFGDQVGPIMLPAGDRQITISLADEMNPCGGDVVLDVTVPFMDDENVTVIAYLDEMGAPTAGKFDNDFSETDPGTARIMLHHTAAAPMVDVAVNRDEDAMFSAAIEDFANGDQVVVPLRPGEWYVWLAPAGSTDPVFGPELVQFKPFTTYRVFAVGSIGDGSFQLLAFANDVKEKGHMRARAGY
jgi:hypothetical protein